MTLRNSSAAAFLFLAGSSLSASLSSFVSMRTVYFLAAVLANSGRMALLP
jgi:hypothetical protein